MINYKLPDKLKYLILFSDSIPIKLKILLTVESNPKYSNHLINVKEMYNFYFLRQTPARIYIGTNEHNNLKKNLNKVLDSIEKWMKFNGENLDINVHGFRNSENSFTVLTDANNNELVGLMTHTQ